MSIGQKMHYQMQLAESEQKKKKALVAVCTLGLSQTPIVQNFKDAKKTTKQMSFGDSPAGDIFMIVIFVVWSVIIAAVLWIINIFRLINYAEHCHRLKKVIAAE